MKKIQKRIIVLGDKPVEQWIERNENGIIIWASFDKDKAEQYIKLHKMNEEKHQPVQRQTAQITSIKELINGKYVIQEGWKPNYVQTNFRKLVRVNIIGIIVDKPNPYQFIMDDGSASILVIDFNQRKKTTTLKVGNPVLVIGRPRQAEKDLFIASEIATSDQLIKQPLWIVKRKEDLKKLESNLVQKIDSEEVLVEDLDETISDGELVQPISGNVTGDDIIVFMRKKDSGDGVSIDEIVDYFGQEADDVILTLMSMGEVYEIKPGRIKILE